MGNYPNNILKKIKSIYVLRSIFTFIRNNKKLNIIKYNNDLKKKLNVNLNNYMNLIIFELNLIKEFPDFSSQKINFINLNQIDINESISSGIMDIYCADNKNKIFIDKNYLNKKNDYKKIKIIINNENNLITSFERIFFKIHILKEITIIYKKCTVQNFREMFHFCSKLISINLFLEDVCPLDMYSIFGECISLKSIEGISKWNTYKNTNFGRLFFGCESLKKIPDISKWNTINAKNMSSIFYRCCSLEELPDISKWDISNVIEIDSIFFECKLLKKIPDISEWNTKNIVDMQYMFAFCRSLEYLPDISRWNTVNLQNIRYMFFDCRSLVSLPDLTKWNISEECNTGDIFGNCLLLELSKKIKNKFKILI